MINIISAKNDICCNRQKFVNGEEFQEDGKFKTVAGMDVIVTKGSYTIVEKDGSITVVNYTADEHGFHPEIGEISLFLNKFRSFFKYFLRFYLKWFFFK